jgi:hypothetical protein
MPVKEMDKLILEELEHIPAGEQHSPQNLMRMLYGAQRRKQLARNPDGSPIKSLQKAFAATTKEYPYFAPTFDVSFFASLVARGASHEGRPR